MTNVIVAPETRDLAGLDLMLARWFSARMPEAEDLRIVEIGYPSGAGRSHETLLLTAAWREGASELARGFVVRIKPTRFTVYPDDMFEEQFEVLRVLRAHGAVRVPNALFLERDPALFGAPFFVMERARGRVPVSTPPYAQVGWVAQATPAQRRRLWQNAVHQLAAIQSVPLDSVGFLARKDAREGLEQEWAKYERFVDWLDADAPQPVLRAALARLRSLWPSNQPTGLVWGDARIGNMMFDEDFEVSAVLDWEQPSLGGALHDLAWFLRFSRALHGASEDRPHLDGMGTREETIALWQRLTGHSVDDLEWYEDFVELKCGCTGVRMSRLQNVTFFDDATLARRLKV